jgi:hypothetical protein
MSGVTGHYEKITTLILKGSRHVGQDLPGTFAVVQQGILAVRNLRVLVNYQPHMILIAVAGRQSNHFGHEIDGRLRAHAAEHANC